MILNADEKAKFDKIILDLEAIASLQTRGPTRDAIYRNAADLRRLTAAAPVTKSGRADGHRC